MASLHEDASSSLRKSESKYSRLRPPKRGTSLAEQSRNSNGIGPDLSDFVRYRDPDSGQTWCGYGRPPNWIRGKDRERFSTQGTQQPCGMHSEPHLKEKKNWQQA